MKKNFAPRETLPFVNKPGRYLGHEYNAISKEWNTTSLRWALIFPDLYEIGMSHQGLQILYHILNSQDTVLAERCYCPDKDMEDILREKRFPLSSLENNRPLNDFDILGFTLPYELCYTNILTVLDLAGIPLRATERNEEYPIVLGGGSCSLNPEPVADFFDAILLGDGEEAVLEIATCVQKTKADKLSKNETLKALAAIEGVYIPSFFEPVYSEDGEIIKIKALESDFACVKRRVLADLSSMDHLLHPLVPNSKIVHDRLGVEIARGCTRGCRFCQAGMIYRPVRERSPEQIFDLACKGIENSGFDELALLSLSTGDYSCLATSLPQLMNRFASEAISVSMPSMRVGTLTPELMDEIKRVRKTGFTLAPEAGSERLRRVINKGITEEDLLNTSRDAFGLGWKVMKLYFMIGLPTETDEDIEAIAELARKTKKIGNQAAPGRQQINVSIGTFVPKPHTPFQWNSQISMEESRDKINALKRMLPRKGINLKWHDPQQSFLEGVFSRGDRRLSALLETAWKHGARLDGWSDYFKLERWQQSADECGIVLSNYLLAKDIDTALPWQHLHSRIDESFLKEELQKGMGEEYTPDCRYHSCQKCGLCDFKTLKPVVIDRKQSSKDDKTAERSDSQSKPVIMEKEELHVKYMVSYSRLGDICYLGHLELLQVVFRILRRAKIKTNYSKGFNPSPKVSFGPALPVGTRSMAEYFVMDLPSPLPDFEEAKTNLNKQMPPGLIVKNIALHNGAVPQQVVNAYTITLHPPLNSDEIVKVQHFMETDSFMVQRTRKRKTKEIDIRPLVSALTIHDEGSIEMQIISRASEAGVKPLEAIAAITGKKQEYFLSSEVLKTAWQPL
ncbi:MAG: TIGR03960 family B12-binding radical SAM protein [Desulfocapsa sp.]|nr:MAG: TIGR03960 family B12-binding radical SAM protein [Desulfocapsa sp.]